MSASSTAAWLRRGLLILLCACLAWRIVALGMAEFYADQIATNPAAADAALAWYPRYPKALRSLAARLESGDPSRAENLLIRAAQADPTDGRVLLRLANLWRGQGKMEQADQACELAERLLPADAKLRLAAAQYWLNAGNLKKTLQNWDLAMQIDPALATPLYPILLDLAKDPSGLSALGEVLFGAPPWWPDFFAYAAKNAAQMDTLRGLYAIRRTVGQAPGHAEINAYLERLMADGFWAEAYLVWINALRPEQQAVLGYLYDGGFELTGFQGAFDWSSSADKSLQVTTHYTQMATGRKALHVVLNGRTLPSSIVEQTMFLLPGHYRFTGRVRPDALQAGAGLEWTLECASGAGGRLAGSERFLGSDTWRQFSLDFDVSTNACAGVKLRLQPLGYQAESREFKGEIWFDDLAVELAGEPAATSLERPSAGPAKARAIRRR